MHIDFHVEEPSAEIALRTLVPKIIEGRASFDVFPYQGKRAMLKRLPARLKGYATWAPPDHKIVVLVDRDADDCQRLKRQLDAMAKKAGLMPKSSTGKAKTFQVVNRIVVEELEAWFFGDVEALCAAYPGVPRTLHARTAYRDPDAIRGGTWEALERVLKAAGYYQRGLAKLKAAEEISRHMEPARNRSRSFQVFREAVLQLIGHRRRKPAT